MMMKQGLDYVVVSWKSNELKTFSFILFLYCLFNLFVQQREVFIYRSIINLEREINKEIKMMKYL